MAEELLSDADVGLLPEQSAQPGNLLSDSDVGLPAILRPPSSALRRYVADPAIGLAKGIVGLPEAIVGLADIPTLGYAGKILEAGGYGFQPKVTKDYLSTLYSPEQQAANAEVQKAKGFFPTVRAMVENPSTIVQTVGESVPSMLGGAGVARKFISVAPKLAPLITGAIGEGAVTAGQQAEQTRQDSESGLLTPKQAALSATSGAATGLIGVLGGGLAKRLGVTDIDTLMAGGSVSAQAAKKGVLRRVVESAITEGALEELPQSAQEQFQQNIANNRPKWDGVAEAAATGLLAGLVMGGAGGLAVRPTRPAVLAPPNVTEVSNVENRESSPMGVPAGQPAESVPPDAGGTPGQIQNTSAALSQGQRAEAQSGVVPIVPAPTTKLAPIGNSLVIEPARQKLLENMQGRTVNVLPTEMDAPSAHLQSIFGKNAPTWRQLMDAGLLETTTPGAPARPGDVGLVITRAAQLPENIGGTLGVASENLPPDAQAIEAANKAKQIKIFAEASGVPYVEGDTGAMIQAKIKAKAASVNAQPSKEAGAAAGTPTVVEQPAVVKPVAEPWQMRKSEGDPYLDKQMINAVKTDKGRIIARNIEHGDLLPALEETGNTFKNSNARGWALVGRKPSESYIGIFDVNEAKGDFHKAYVMKALREGKPVPQSVLSDYSDLAASSLESAKISQSDAAIAKGGINGLPSNVEFFSRLFQSPAFTKSGLNSLEIPTQREVVARVIAALHQPEIFDSIIKLVPVDVVNNLVRRNASSDVIFHDKGVFSNMPSSDLKDAIAIPVNVADALARAVTRLAAKERSGATNAIRDALERSSAVGASELYHGKQIIPKGAEGKPEVLADYPDLRPVNQPATKSALPVATPTPATPVAETRGTPVTKSTPVSESVETPSVKPIAKAGSEIKPEPPASETKLADMRYFIPTTNEAPAILGKVIAHRPIVEASGLGNITPTDTPGGSANIAERAIAGIEDLQKKLRGSGSDVSMGVPKAILDLALEVARLSLKAGNTIYQAIDAAIAKIREQLGDTPFDEAQVRESLNREFVNGDDRAREGEGDKAITQVQSVKVGIEREVENIAAIQKTIRADIFDGTQPVSASATDQARALFVRLTDPAGKAAAAGDILTKTNAQMGPGLVLAELWRYAERTVLATGDDSFLRQIVPHYQDFPLGEAGAGATAFGRGLRALQETDTLFKQLYEIEKEKRTAAGEKMSVRPELLEELLAGLKGEVPDAAVLERKTRTVLGTKVPQGKVEEIVRVVRANPVDPIMALVDHFSKMAGFPEVTPEQHEQLIKLAQQLSDPNLSIPDKSALVNQMFEVFNRMKLPPSLLTRLAANLVATNLTGFKTLGINIFSPNVQGLVELGLTGITSPRDFTAMLKGAIDGGKQWLANIRYSMGRDAYSFLNNDYQAAQNVLKQMWQRGLQQMKSNSVSERSRGLANIIFGSQQYYMRLLNAVDNANGILRRQMQMSLYSSQAMRRLGMSAQEIRDVTDMFYLMRDQFYAQAVEMGLTENQSRIRADALAYQEFVDFLNNELPADSAGRPLGSEIAKAANHEAVSVLGRLSEGVKEIDEGGLVKRTVGAPILYLSNWMRQQEGLMPAIGVSLLGYVNVPYRTASYYAWNTPYGLVRLGIHKWRKSKGKESWWKQSLATEFQEQQRLKNALAGSAVLAALTGLGIGLLKASADDDAGDDDDNGVYFTGNGPKNKTLRSAWMAKGFKPQSLVVFVGGKPIPMELSRSGESFAHYAWLLSARDDRAWREKEAKTTNRKYAPTPSKEAAYAIGTYLGLLGQRGFLGTVTQAGNVASGQSDPLAFAASKGGSFISGLFTPGLGLQRSVQGLLHGPVDTSSVQSAFMANFTMLSIAGVNHPKVNAFGDQLYNPENSWYHKMKETGIPIAFSTSPTTENKQLYGVLVEKGVAPRELRRSTVENAYGPLTDEQFAEFARRNGKIIKSSTLSNLANLRTMAPEDAKKWLNKTATNADKITAIGMGLERVKPPKASTARSVISIPSESAGAPRGISATTRRAGLRRYGLSAIRPIRLSTRSRGRTRRLSTRRSRVRSPRLSARRAPRGTRRISIARIRRPSISSFV